VVDKFSIGPLDMVIRFATEDDHILGFEGNLIAKNVILAQAEPSISATLPRTINII